MLPHALLVPPPLPLPLLVGLGGAPPLPEPGSSLPGGGGGVFVCVGAGGAWGHAVFASRRHSPKPLVGVDSVWSADAENNAESMFEVQFADQGENPFYDDGGTAAEGQLRNVMIGPQQGGGWENLFCTKSLAAEFEDNDKRRPLAILFDGESHACIDTVKIDDNKADTAIIIKGIRD